MAEKRLDGYDLIDSLSDDYEFIVWNKSAGAVNNGTPLDVARYVSNKGAYTVGPAGSGAFYETDGTADDTQFQAAIDAATAAGGGEVKVLAGEYNGGKITAKAGVSIIFADDANYTLANATNDHIIEVISLADIRLKVNLDGNKANQSTAAKHGIYMTNSSGCSIDARVTNTYADGVFLDGSDNNQVDIRSIDCGRSGTADGDGIRIGGDHNRVNAYVEGCEGDGILIKGSYNTVLGNVKDPVSSGLSMTTESEKTVKYNNVNVVVENAGGNGAVLDHTTGTSTEISYNTVVVVVNTAALDGVTLEGENNHYNSITATVRNATERGVQLIGSGSGQFGHTVTATCISNGQQGLSVSGVKMSQFVVDARLNTGDGVFCSSNFNSFYVNSNENGGKAVFISGGNYNYVTGVGGYDEAGVDINNGTYNNVVGFLSHDNGYGFRERGTSNYNMIIGTVYSSSSGSTTVGANTKMIINGDDVTYSPYIVVATDGSGDYNTDGTADDVQIQAAIDAASAAGGGVVYLMQSTYDITETITVPDDVTLQGGGWTTILIRNASMTTGRIVEGSDMVGGNSNVVIKDLKVDGNSSAVTPADNMESIRFDIGTNIYITNVFALNSPSEGIQLHRVTNGHISYCRAEGTALIGGSYKAGIILSGSSDSLQSSGSSITHCYTLNTSGEGVGLYYANGCQLIGNTTNWTSGASNRGQIQLEQSENCTVTGNTVTSNYYGVVNLSCDRMTIADNVVKESAEDGMTIEGSTRDISVTGNILNNVGHHGIHVIDTTRNITIADNKIVDAGQVANNTYDAIHLDPNGGYVRRATITGNHAYAGATNKIRSFLGTTTDGSNQVTNLIEKGNQSEDHVSSFRTIDNYDYVSFYGSEYTVATDGSGDYNTDGTADDVQIQAAIDAASAAGGGEVKIKQGSYSLTSPLTIKSNVTLVGENLSTILTMPNATNIDLIDSNTGGLENVTIRSITFDGNGANQTGGTYLIDIAGDSTKLENIVIEKCSIKNSYKHALFLHGDNTGYYSKIIRDNVITNHGTGSIGYGIYIDYAPNTLVQGNTLYNSNGNDAIELGNLGQITCDSNYLEDGDINFPFADDSIISNNTLRLGQIINDTNSADNVTITGNHILNATPPTDYAGIRVDGNNSVITGNHVVVSNDAGIRVQNGDYHLIEGNYIDGQDKTLTTGGVKANTADHVKVSNNTIRRFNEGVRFTHDDVTVNSNHVDDCVNGIEFADSTVSGHVILRATVKDNVLKNCTTSIDTTNQALADSALKNNEGHSKVVSMTDGATITPNSTLTDTGTVTIAGNRTVAAPTGTPAHGQTLTLRVKQDATGSRTLTWNAIYRFSGGTAPTLTTTASKTDYILFIYNSTDSKWDHLATQLDM